MKQCVTLVNSSSRKRSLDDEDKNAAYVDNKWICSHVEDGVRKCQSCDGQWNPWRKKCLKLEAHLFKDNSTSKGGQVKEAAEVLMFWSKNCSRPTITVNCRVEAFAKICKCFDDRRKKWVREMGFGGLLYLVGMRLPRNLCYWLMSRMDPINKLLIAPDGHEYTLSKEHVSWILGIPNGKKVVPKKVLTEKMKSKVSDIERKYGRVLETKRKKSGKTSKQKIIYLTPALMKRAKGSWEEEDEEEFKTLFLMLALVLVLCPTLGTYLESGLVPALTCAMRANNYDWCGLVLEKLMVSIKRFATKFYAEGYSFGCGGCSILLAIFYLDRLDRDPVAWGEWPRIRVWTTEEINKARDEDRIAQDKDFGNLRCLDVSYGEKHPWNAWDMDGHASLADEELQPKYTVLVVRGKRKPRRKTLKQVMHSEMVLLEKAGEGMLQTGVPNELPQATEIPAVSLIVDGGLDPHCGDNDDGNGEIRFSSPSPNEIRITRLDDLDGQPDLNSKGSPRCLASLSNGIERLNFIPTSEEMHTEITPCDKRLILSTSYIRNSTHVSSDCSKEVDENAGDNLRHPPLCQTSLFNAANSSGLTPAVGEMHSENTASCDKITTMPARISYDNYKCLSCQSPDKFCSLMENNVDTNEISTSQRSDSNAKKTKIKEKCEIVNLDSSDDDNDDNYPDPLKVLGYYDMVARISKLKKDVSSMKALRKNSEAN